jgi:hypothetical protein
LRAALGEGRATDHERTGVSVLEVILFLLFCVGLALAGLGAALRGRERAAQRRARAKIIRLPVGAERRQRIAVPSQRRARVRRRRTRSVGARSAVPFND